MANNTELNTGPFVWGAAQNAAGQPDDTIARTGPDISRETFMDDTFRAFMLLYRSGVWHKGMNADLLDGQHADEFQPICATLTALCALTSYGLVAKTAEDTIAAREITVGTGLDIVNGDGIAGNPDITLDVTELTTVTAVAGDHVVISDTTDSTTKKALISDIVALVPAGAPASAQYVTLATDATLANERVLTAGTGLDLADAGAGSTITIDVDLNELSTVAAAAADTVVFVDNDDSATKKTTMADLAVALSVPTTAVTAASTFAGANRVIVADGADRSADDSDFTMTQDGTNAVGVAAGTGITFGALNLTTTGTLASGAHTITVAGGGLVLAFEDDGTNGERRYIEEVQTTDATVTAIIDIPRPSAAATCALEYIVTGVEAADSTKRFVQREVREFYDNAGTLTLGTSVEGPNTANSFTAGGTVAAVASGTNIRITVRGAGATTINWGVVAKVSWRNTTT